MVISSLNFGLIIFCIHDFIQYWIRPDLLRHQKGLVNGMNAAIAYDSISLMLLFLIFFSAVNMKVDEMLPFFYNGIPPFVFEITM